MTPASGPRCFLHVPKCAGSSVTHAITQSLPPGTVSPKIQEGLFWMVDWDPEAINPQWRKHMVVDDDDVQELSGYDVVMGHFSLPLLHRITAPSLVATVLREPRARLLSDYAYWRLASDQFMWQGWSLADFAWRPLDEFLGSSLVAGETDNVICRMLVGGDERIPLHGLIAPGDVSGVASRAIEALDTLGFVGLVELGDSMWKGISAFFDVIVTPTTVNTTDGWGAVSTAPGIDLAITPQTLELPRSSHGRRQHRVSTRAGGRRIGGRWGADRRCRVRNPAGACRRQHRHVGERRQRARRRDPAAQATAGCTGRSAAPSRGRSGSTSRLARRDPGIGELAPHGSGPSGEASPPEDRYRSPSAGRRLSRGASCRVPSERAGRASSAYPLPHVEPGPERAFRRTAIRRLPEDGARRIAHSQRAQRLS